MIKARQLLLSLALLLSHSAIASAQLLTPVHGGAESQAAKTDDAGKKRPPVLAAKWPFKFGRGLFQKKETVDPFTEGAAVQRQLASQITGQGATVVNTPHRPVASNAMPAGRTYPWPAPISSGPQAYVPTNPSASNTWGNPNATADAARPTANAPIATPTNASVAQTAPPRSAAVPSTQMGSPTIAAPASAAVASTDGNSGAVVQTSTNIVTGPRFSHFAASTSSNPPPAAVPIRTTVPTPPVQMKAPPNRWDSSIALSELVPSTQTAPGTNPNLSPPTTVPNVQPPTALAAGPPTNPPQANSSASIPVTSPNQEVAQVAANSPTAQTTTPQPPSEKKKGFSIARMDQSIWGPSMSNRKPSAPAAAPTTSSATKSTLGLSRESIAAATQSASNVNPPTMSPPTSASASATLGAPEQTLSQASPAVSQASPAVSQPPPPATSTPSRDDSFVGKNQSANQPIAAHPSIDATQLATSTRPVPAKVAFEPTISAPAKSFQAPPLEQALPSLATPSPGMEAPGVETSSTLSAVHGTPDEATRVLAIVGDQSILAGDVLGQVNEMLAPYKGQAPESQLALEREKLVQKLLPKLIERKLIFYDFIKKIPADRIPEIESSVFKHFNEKRLPEVLEQIGLASVAEYDAKLRELGSSLASQQRMFFEQMVAHEAVQREAKQKDEVTHEEMLAYYNKHIADYSFPAKVRWERLAVNPTTFATHEEAYNAVARMGNEVYRGAPFVDVAKRSSQGPRAANGGSYAWTTQGSLKDKELDRLLFVLPVQQMSKVISSGDLYQIIRVVERTSAGNRPFTDVQNEIKQKIKEERFDERVRSYIDRLKAETYVWTSTSGQQLPPQFANQN